MPSMSNHPQTLITPPVLALTGLLLSPFACPLLAQAVSGSSTNHSPAPLNWTAAQDHQNMMQQLGVARLRPGPSGNVNAPDAANYDQSKANPYPDYPDALTLKNGTKVTT